MIDCVSENSKLIHSRIVVCVVIASLTSSSSSSNGEKTGVYVGLGGSFTGSENVSVTVLDKKIEPACFF